MQPIIKANAWYTLVTAKNEAINASWCKQQLARILKKSTDAIILFDVTGSYAALVLDHDRLIPGQVPMAVKQYKSTHEGFVLAHTVKVDVEDSQEPRLLVFDVSWVMAFSWKKGIAAITKILKVWVNNQRLKSRACGNTSLRFQLCPKGCVDYPLHIKLCPVISE
mgnify:CR=1 FL=1